VEGKSGFEIENFIPKTLIIQISSSPIFSGCVIFFSLSELVAVFNKEGRCPFVLIFFLCGEGGAVGTVVTALSYTEKKILCRSKHVVKLHFHSIKEKEQNSKVTPLLRLLHTTENIASLGNQKARQK
jgi:hypothetical protein